MYEPLRGIPIDYYSHKPIQYGVDGAADGWIAVWYDDEGYVDSDYYGSISQLWTAHRDHTDTILIDVPIGLREDSGTPRPCDTAARERLSPTRHNSVFPVPIREAVHADSYEAAKAAQTAHTDRSLGVQSWGIASKIAEVDTFLRDTAPEAQGTIRESHPEVCFWALNDETPTEYSKTGQPAAAFWERVDTLEQIEESVLTHIRDASVGLDATVGNDDVVDAFCLAVTASTLTGEYQTLPEEGPSDENGDPRGLPMEMVYATP
jgi:predicted RNase H-like nuclease